MSTYYLESYVNATLQIVELSAAVRNLFLCARYFKWSLDLLHKAKKSVGSMAYRTQKIHSNGGGADEVQQMFCSISFNLTDFMRNIPGHDLHIGT